MTQQVTGNGAQVFSYGQVAQVVAGGAAVVCAFDAPAARKIIGLTIGMGISDVTAWGAGASFEVHVGGVPVLFITDQLSDLIRPAFFPIEVPAKAAVVLYYKNGATAPVVDVAATVRVEV